LKMNGKSQLDNRTIRRLAVVTDGDMYP
jgi:hypothetical protein